MTMAAYIEQDLEARIRAGGALPTKLTLSRLSEHYSVSLTPIRMAVEQLIDRRLLVKQENGRISLNPQRPNVGRRSRPVVLPQLPKDWFSILANDIVRQSLKGEAIFLREEAEALRHGIGRTMLRHAFSKLAGQGLLEHLPRRGFRIRPFREEDMFAYLDVREVLELRALDLARPHIVAEDLEAILAANQPGDGQVRPRLDNRLHQYFINKAGNRYIKDFFAMHGGYYMTLFNLVSVDESIVNEMIEQHREILGHVLAFRWAKARQALAHHIQPPRPLLRKMIAFIGESLVEP